MLKGQIKLRVIVIGAVDSLFAYLLSRGNFCIGMLG